MTDLIKVTEKAQNADFRRKPQIFADSPLPLESQAFGERRKPQKTADFRRKPICPFPLSRAINSTYEEQSRKGPRHNPDLSRKKVGNPLVWKPLGLASLKPKSHDAVVAAIFAALRRNRDIGVPKGGCFDQGLFSKIASRGFCGSRGFSKCWNL